MPREIEEPTVDENGYETHPAFGLIGVRRGQVGGAGGGAVLFDSDIRHGHVITVRVCAARRQRDLHRDWIGTDGRVPLIEVEMSLSQFGAFVASNGVGDGVPCTIKTRGDLDEFQMPGIPFEPRMKHSMAEVRSAAAEAVREVTEAFEAYEAHRIKANRDRLKYAIRNLPSNLTHAAKSLTEHSENVVQKATADIEAMLFDKARALGLDTGDLPGVVPQLEEGQDGENGG